MSRRLLAFLLSELRTIRVICKHTDCGAVTELPIEKLGTSYLTPKCGVCGNLLGPPESSENTFLLFHRALLSFRANAHHFDFEFILPDADEPRR